MKILVLTNHSYMLWRFRKELISTLPVSYTHLTLPTT